MRDHYDDEAVHGVVDRTNLDRVLATTIATNEATAWTLLNALKTAHDAHIATARLAAGDTIRINDLVFTAGTSTVAAPARTPTPAKATAPACTTIGAAPNVARPTRSAYAAPGSAAPTWPSQEPCQCPNQVPWKLMRSRPGQ
jgi:hypothetical protein